MVLARTKRGILRWDVATGEELPPLPLPSRGLNPWCAASPDGHTLALGCIGEPPQVVVVDLRTGAVQHRLEGVRSPKGTGAFSPDGRTLAAPDADQREVWLWEVASGRPRGRLQGQAVVLAFSPNGRLLVGGGGHDQDVTFWDLASGAVVGTLRHDLGLILSLNFAPDGRRIAMGGESPAALVCDVAALCGKEKVEEIFPSAEELKSLWTDLGDADGLRAYRAVMRLGATGPGGAEFLEGRLKKGTDPDERRLAQLIADLDHEEFARREKASRELEALDGKAGPALRQALEGRPSAEVRARVERLLQRLDKSTEGPSPELVLLRVVEALEVNATPQARQVLTELAATHREKPLGREATASLERLARRSAVKP
jgi:hypothetical protein